MNPPPRGSRLDADHPEYGVFIPRRLTSLTITSYIYNLMRFCASKSLKLYAPRWMRLRAHVPPWGGVSGIFAMFGCDKFAAQGRFGMEGTAARGRRAGGLSIAPLIGCGDTSAGAPALLYRASYWPTWIMDAYGG